MPIDDLTSRFSSLTSRRSIVRTGAKLAYATPLVAASMKLSGGGAAAISGGTTFTVPGGAVDGISTGLSVTAGQQICVDASSGLVLLCAGEVSPRLECPTGPAGDPGLGAACGPISPCGILIGIINGSRFVLGASGCTVAPGTGVLSLAVNDLPSPAGYADNTGSYVVTISIQP